MAAPRNYISGIHYELDFSDGKTALTEKELCFYGLLSALIPNVIEVDDSLAQSREINLTSINDSYGLKLTDRKMSFEKNNIDLANEGIKKTFEILETLLIQEDHFDTIFERIIETVRFIFALLLCLTYNQECLKLSSHKANQEHAETIENLNLFEGHATRLVNLLLKPKFKDSDRSEWLQLVWFTKHVLKALKNSSVFPGFLKELIDMEMNHLLGRLNDDSHKCNEFANIVQIKKHANLGRVIFMEPFTRKTLDEMSSSYLVDVSKNQK